MRSNILDDSRNASFGNVNIHLLLSTHGVQRSSGRELDSPARGLRFKFNQRQSFSSVSLTVSELGPTHYDWVAVHIHTRRGQDSGCCTVPPMMFKRQTNDYIFIE